MEYTGHGAHTRPWIGLSALAAFFLVLAALITPALASAADTDDSASQSRIIGGSNATAADVSATGRWSAVVAIFATDTDGTRLCTGTVIAKNWIATAGHCIAQSANAQAPIDPSNVFVAANTTSVATAGDHLISAVSTWVHPGFSWTNASWDVALIELQNTVPTTPFSLPDPSRPTTYAVGTTDNIAGFGRSQASASASSGTLRSGRLEQVDADSCAQYNPGSGDYADCYLPGSARQATCFGDSGGPLVRFDTTQSNTPVLWGITSTGPDPCDAATAGGFAPSYETRVTSVLPWIQTTIARSTYVPVALSTSRSATTTTTTTTGTTGSKGGAATLTRAPAGGTGIGIFQTKLSAKPTKSKAAKVTLSSSFVGATGTGLVEIQRCKKSKCKTVTSASVSYAAAAVTYKATIGVPRCAKGTVMNLKLTVTDAAGTQRDAATQRLAKCK